MKFICHVSTLLCFLLITSFSLAQDSKVSQTKPKSTPQPQIFGMKDHLDAAQIKRIVDAQESFLKRHKCIVSYGFFSDIPGELQVLRDWKKFAEQDTEKHFHLFLRIGTFSDSHTISTHYRYPPALQDVSEIDKILLNLGRDLQSENYLDDVIDTSFSSIEDALSYLKNRPKYEAKEQKKASDFEASQLKAYIIKIAKLVLYIAVPLLAILFIWVILSKILNRRPYLFPEVKYTPRLGAKYSAKSVSQIKK